jgi:NAD(P)-dependent dehydrogenase (short-subunit alcohol dehydrogenase family)
MKDAGSDTKRLALVTGASRKEGIGCEVARQLARKGFHVVVSARTASAAAARAEELVLEGLDVVGQVLDVTDDESVKALAWKLGAKFGRLDVLVNNAATPPDHGELPSRSDLSRARQAMETTFLGAWRVTQAFLPLLRKGEHPRVVNVSSGAGSHGDPVMGLHTKKAMSPAYAASKAALNALTVPLARELAADGILVNAVCPGSRAGAAGIVWAALLPDDGPTGGFFRNAEPLAW